MKRRCQIYRDGVNSTRMVEYQIEGKQVKVPDFYKKSFPDLYKTEVLKQLNNRQTIQPQTPYSSSIGQYEKSMQDIEKMLDLDPTNLN